MTDSGEDKEKPHCVLSDDVFHMALALLAAQRSKDPKTQVGCCIYDEDGQVVGSGYNGFPWGCCDNILPWSKASSSMLDTKFPYVCHAEFNAVLNSVSEQLYGCTLFVTLFPCNQCTKIIIQSGIKRVIYLDRKAVDKPETLASERMLKMVGIEVVPFDTLAVRPPVIHIDFTTFLDDMPDSNGPMKTSDRNDLETILDNLAIS